MIHAISSPPFDQGLVSAPNHWGGRVRAYIIQTFGSWRDKILTAAAVYQVVQAIFLVLGGYFLAGVISAGMGALCVKTIKDLKEFASLDRATSRIENEGNRYGLLNLQMAKKLEDFQKKNEEYGRLLVKHGLLLEEQRAENAEYGRHNVEHGLLNEEHRAENYQYGLHNEEHGWLNAEQRVENVEYARHNFEHRLLKEGYREENAEYARQNLKHAEYTAKERENNAKHEALVKDQQTIVSRLIQLAEYNTTFYQECKKDHEASREEALNKFEACKEEILELQRRTAQQANSQTAKAIEELNGKTTEILHAIELSHANALEFQKKYFEKREAELDEKGRKINAQLQKREQAIEEAEARIKENAKMQGDLQSTLALLRSAATEINTGVREVKKGVKQVNDSVMKVRRGGKSLSKTGRTGIIGAF
ncbi:MAG: hypothetical protein JSS30_00085 [Verrucomicrobia bacterium]|nr:hypothetical protein [Verrucomicrobiota bacterium]